MRSLRAVHSGPVSLLVLHLWLLLLAASVATPTVSAPVLIPGRESHSFPSPAAAPESSSLPHTTRGSLSTDQAQQQRRSPPGPQHKPRAAPRARPHSHARPNTAASVDASSLPAPPAACPPPIPPTPPYPPQDPAGAVSLTRWANIFLVGDSTDRELLHELCRLCTAPPGPEYPDGDLDRLSHLSNNTGPYVCDVERRDEQGATLGACGGHDTLRYQEVLAAYACRCPAASAGGSAAAFVHGVGVMRPAAAAAAEHTFPGLEAATPPRVRHALHQFQRYLRCSNATNQGWEGGGQETEVGTQPGKVVVVVQSVFWDVASRRRAIQGARWRRKGVRHLSDKLFAVGRDKRAWLEEYRAALASLVQGVQRWGEAASRQCGLEVCVVLRTQHFAPKFGPFVEDINAQIRSLASEKDLPLFDWWARVEEYRASEEQGSAGRAVRADVLSDGLHQRTWVSQRLLRDLARFCRHNCYKYKSSLASYG